MKNYIKPTFTLAGISPLAMAAGSCSIDEDGKAMLEDMHGITDWSKVFVSDKDGCVQTVDGFDTYCKFTSEGIANPIVVIGS